MYKFFSKDCKFIPFYKNITLFNLILSNIKTISYFLKKILSNVIRIQKKYIHICDTIKTKYYNLTLCDNVNKNI